MGVEPQAVEQPLDLIIPENKMMLAFYLAAPEVENDRRALNVIHGMRRAKKEGRYIGLTPISYINMTDPTGKKYIAPHEPQTGIIKWAFDQIAAGVFNTEQIFLMAKEKGFSGVKSLFWMVIRNPVYCGKIFIPKYKDEEAQFVKGVHEPLISEGLFYQVQDVLDGRKRTYRLKIVSHSTLPLRGFLICPHCNKLLTGSASKGRSKYYSYYHCTGDCTSRFKAEEVNELFVGELRKYVPRIQYKQLYKIVLEEEWQRQTGHDTTEQTKLRQEIQAINEELKYTNKLLSTKQLTPAEFREIKSDLSINLEKKEAKLKFQYEEEVNFPALLDQGIEKLLTIDTSFENGDIETQRQIIGSMYPEKLTFSGSHFRTTRINDAVQCIYSLSVAFDEKGKGQSGNFSSLSSLVGKTGLEHLLRVNYLDPVL